MGNLIALIFVVMVIVMGIGTMFIITASGSTNAAQTDTFGATASNQTLQQNNESAAVAVSTWPIMLIPFFIAVCVILVAAFAWLWKTGKSKASKY